jgi:2-oxoglutarate/2-oxoacid ferredoxin oxidoreductase subunit alpha
MERSTVPAKRNLTTGNTAVGWKALAAGCYTFFDYHVTPQNEITEWFAREFPTRGMVFVQSQCEAVSMNMLYDGEATSVWVMTSTVSVG